MGVKKELWINSPFFRVFTSRFSRFYTRFSRSKDCGGPFLDCLLFACLSRRQLREGVERNRLNDNWQRGRGAFSYRVKIGSDKGDRPLKTCMDIFLKIETWQNRSFHPDYSP